MSKYIMKIVCGSFFTITYLMFNFVATAEESPNALADLWIIVPNADQQAEFEQAFIKHIKYRTTNGEPRDWKTYKPIIGSDLNRYIVRFCCTKWNDVDIYNKWNSDNKISQNWNNNVDKYVASYEHLYTRIDFANSNWPKDNNQFKYFAVTNYQAKMGMSNTINEGKKTLSDYAKAMKWPYYWSWGNQIGGNGGLSLVIPYKNFAGMTPPEKSFSQAVAIHLNDKEKAKEVFKKWYQNFESTTYTVYRLVDNMSMATK